jgi:predicted nucleic acid-binding protein
VIVLDAAALVDVVIDQPSASWVLDHISGHDVCAPAHQPAEVLSALTRLSRGGVLDPSRADQALAEAWALEQEFVVPTLAHARRAMQLRANVRVLDGLYLALAEEHRCALVTTDRRLAAAADGSGVLASAPGDPAEGTLGPD